MAADIGVKVSVEGYSQFKNEIQQITQQQKTLKSEMQAVSSAWDKNTSAEKKNAEQKKILNQQIEAQKQKVEKLQEVLAKVEDKYGENSKEANSWREALNKATTELNQMQTALQNIPNGIENLGNAMQSAGQKISAAGDALMPISAAVAAVGVAAVKTTAEFDASMSKVSAISGTTGEELTDLRNKAREMGAETKFSATEAADAMTYMAMAGWKTQEMMSGIDGIMNLAAADGLDLATTADIVTDSLSAMGLSAEDAGHFADVLAAAATNANTNVSMMGETFKYAAPLAGAMGYNIEDLAVATGLMANSGIKGSQAGTALRGLLTRLAKPTKESSQAMKDLYIALDDGEGNMRSFMQMIEILRDRFADLTEEEKTQYAAMLAGQNGMSGLLAIVNASEKDLKKLAAATKNADGTAKRMAETMQDNLNGQLTILQSQLSEAAISVGDVLTPKIRELTGYVQTATDWFNKLSDEEKENVVQMGIYVAAAAPMLKITGKVVEVAGKGVENFGTLVRTVENMGGVMNATNAVLGITSVQLGLVLAPLVALGAAFYVAGQKITGIDLKLEGFIEGAKQTKTVVEENSAAIQAMSDAMDSTAQNIKSSGSTLDYWRRQLNSCYDANGNLREGMENLAEYALKQLNEAMGSDYSTEFIAQAKDSKAALEEINGAIDDNIAKLKEQALQQAFASEYTQAIKNQAEAKQNLQQAEIEVTRAIEGQAQAQKKLEDAMKNDPMGKRPAVISEAKKEQLEYNKLVEDTSNTFIEASKNVAKADANVSSLDSTMRLLGEGGVDAVNKASDAYANAGNMAQLAAQKSEQAARDSIQTWETEVSQRVISPPDINQEEAKQNADQTTQTMQSEFDKNKFTGYVDKVDGGDAAAMNAAGQMTKIVSVPMQGKIDRVDGAESAAQSARSAMQSFLDNHPIIATVVETVTGGRVSRHADGGFVNTKQLSWLAEDGAEVVIPLSASKRGRALELLEETGQILNLNTAYVPGSSNVSNTTYHTGGNTINVYGAPGQDVHELAEAVADLINGDVQSMGATWA